MLTTDQRMLVNMYVRQMNQIDAQIVRFQEQIARLNQASVGVRQSIQFIYGDAINGRTNASASAPAPAPLHVSAPSPSYSYEEMEPDIMLRETTRHLFQDIESPINTECPIRLEPFEPTTEVVQINRCGHIFNRSELQRWFQTNTRCPTCRCELSRNANTNSNRSDQLLSTLMYDLIFQFPASTDVSGNYMPTRRRI